MTFNLNPTAIQKIINSDANAVTPSDNSPLEHRFFVISGEYGPRWVIPENPKWGFNYLKQWKPYSRSSYIKWLVVLAAYRTGFLGKVPGIAHISIDLGDSDKQTVPVIYIGTPNDSRKAVAGIINTSNSEIAGIAKIPLGPVAKEKITHEASVLEQLTAEKPKIAPHLISYNDDTGISIQESINGPLSSSRLTREHIDLLLQLQEEGSTTTLSSHCDNLISQLGQLPSDFNESTQQVVEIVNAISDKSDLPAVWCHGDFAPWNIKKTKHGLALFDWEDAEKSALPLQDICHFHYCQEHLLGLENNISQILKQSPVHDYCQTLAIDNAMADKLAQFYLAKAWCFRAQSGDRDYAAFLLDKLINYYPNLNPG